MITARFERNDQDQLVGFCLTGHAGFSEKGQDIVCAAVSTIAQTIIGTVDETIPGLFNYRIDEEQGLIQLHILEKAMLRQATKDKIQTLLFAAWVGIRQVEEAYPEYVQLIDSNHSGRD